jgi:hypothetical protein
VLGRWAKGLRTKARVKAKAKVKAKADRKGRKGLAKVAKKGS